MKKVLITGASGFIGKAINILFHSQDHPYSGWPAQPLKGANAGKA